MGQYAQAIQQLYVSYFSRPADKAGLAYWESVAEKAKGDLSQISAAFSQSNEYRDTYAGKSHAEVIDQVYVNLFGRHAEEGGKAYWTDLLDKKALSIDHIVESLASGARGNDMMALKYKVTTALSFSLALDTPQEIAGFSSSRAISGAKDLLASVVDASSLISVLAPGGKLEKLLANIATNFGIAVGEPHPGQGVAVGEPHPGQGIAVGEPHPGQGIAVGEPHPGQGIAVGEPTTVDGSKIQGYFVESGCELCGTPNVDITLVGLGVS